MPAGQFGADKGLEKAFNIILRFVMDKQALNDVKNGTETVGVALAHFGLREGDVLTVAMKLAPQLEEQEKAANKLQVAWWRTQRELRAAQFVMTAIAGAGTAIMAPILLAANNWATEMEKAQVVGDKTFDRWKAAQTVIKNAQLEVGRTAAQVLLPTLEKVAVLADKAAKFVEAHPDIIKAALTAGAALVTIGTIGTLLVQGVKLIVDIKFVAASVLNKAAADLMIVAAKNNLEAAALMNLGWKGGPTPVPLTPTGGLQALLAQLVKVLGPIALLAGAAALGSRIGVSAGNTFGRQIYGKEAWGEDRTWGEGIAMAWRTVRTAAAAQMELIVLKQTQMGVISVEQAHKMQSLILSITGLGPAAKNAANDLTSAAKVIETAQKDLEGAKILAKLDSDLLKMAKKYANDRVKIERDMVNDLEKADQDLVKSLADIALSLSRRLAEMAEDFDRNNQKYIEDEAAKEAELLAKSQEDILKMRRDHQKALERLEQEHNNNVIDLAMKNDALGLVMEERRYLQEKANLNEDFKDQVAEKRRETAIQLAEMRAAFAREQAQRLRDYQFQVEREKEQAAQRAADAQAEHDAEIEQIKANEKEKLAELQANYEEERKQRILAAYEDIIALGGALQTESEFKRTYYAYMLQDAEAFVIAYRAALAKIGEGTTTPPVPPPNLVPGGQMGGYASDSLWRLHKGEFIMNPGTTRAAEQLVGQNLTQQNLLAALAGGRASVTVNDHRRFDSRISNEERLEIELSTVELIGGIFS